MGPRVFVSRKLPSPNGGNATVGKLQWGRECSSRGSLRTGAHIRTDTPGFNGAASVRLAEGTYCQGAKSTVPTASMGPRVFVSRKASGPIGKSATSRCQPSFNGAASVRLAEDVDDRVHTARAAVASMGPRVFVSRKCPMPRRAPDARRGASMGPRVFVSRKLFKRLVRNHTVEVASMGPRVFVSRKSGVGRQLLRRRQVASMGPRVFVSRKRKATRACRRTRSAGFNGAASVRLAEGTPTPTPATSTWPLQWGRECSSRGSNEGTRRSCSGTTGFNGAASVRLAEVLGVEAVRQAQVTASMGPRVFVSRKALGLGVVRLSFRCFNGAASVRLAEDPAHGVLRRDGRIASMGPRVFVSRKVARAQLKARRIANASMGPRVFVSRKFGPM